MKRRLHQRTRENTAVDNCGCGAPARNNPDIPFGLSPTVAMVLAFGTMFLVAGYMAAPEGPSRRSYI